MPNLLLVPAGGFSYTYMYTLRLTDDEFAVVLETRALKGGIKNEILLVDDGREGIDMKTRMKGILIAAALCALLMGIFALVGCAGNSSKSTLEPEIVSDIGAYKVTANNAGDQSSVMSGNAVEAEGGQIIVISSDLKEGELTVEITGESDKKAAFKKVSGQTLEICEVDPGAYDVKVTCSADNTTGTVLVCPVDAAEFEKQDQDLDATLAAMAAGN